MVMDVEKLCSYTDFIIVCHGTSARQVQAIITHVREEMKKKGVHPYGAEGEAEGQWIVLDYGDIVLHAFFKPTREFYNLEGIWPDARRAVAQEEDGDVTLAWQGKRLRKADVV
jgi:ribosome-associated protein